MESASLRDRLQQRVTVSPFRVIYAVPTIASIASPDKLLTFNAGEMTCRRTSHMQQFKLADIASRCVVQDVGDGRNMVGDSSDDDQRCDRFERARHVDYP